MDSSELFASIKDFLIQLELFYEKVHEKVADYVEYPEKRRQHIDIDSRINSFILKSIGKILDSKLLDIIVRKHVEKLMSDGKLGPDQIKDYKMNGMKSIVYKSSSLKILSKFTLSKRSPLSKSTKKKTKRSPLSKSTNKKLKRSPLSKSTNKKLKRSPLSKSIKKKSKRSPLSKSIKKK